MKISLSVAFCLLIITSCRKDKDVRQPIPNPDMHYTDLGDTAIRMHHAAQFDLNADGHWDVFFGTLLVGDPVQKLDKHQWLVGSSLQAFLPVNAGERIPVVGKDQLISDNSFPGYSWFNASMIYLVQKIIGENAPPRWEGDWKNASHLYIPIQERRGDDLFHGWVEVSFDTAQDRLLVHRAGMSKLANKAVRAGR